MNRTAFVAFYAVYPSNMGSSEVSSSFFETWKGKKKIFQISHLKNINNKIINTQFIIREKPIYKILKIIPLVKKIRQFLLKNQKPIIIIEGPSWIGYSFFFFIVAKILIPRAFIIYHSHSIEYEIRKNNSNYFISFFTKITEKYIFHNVDLATSVSVKEKKKINNLYNKETIIFPNGVNLKRLQVEEKKFFFKPKQYLFYSGSYLYGPNKQAIDLLNNYFMPKLVKKFPDLKLILTGGGYYNNYSWLINLGIIRKNYLIKLLKGAQLILTPIYEGYGTRVKIIEALMLGVPVVSSSKGIDGIDYKFGSFKNPLVNQNKKILLNYAIKVLRNNKLYKKNSKENKLKYIAIYNMEEIVKKFQFLINKIRND